MPFHFNLPRLPEFVDFTPGFESFPRTPAPAPPPFGPKASKDFGSSAFVFDPKRPIFEIPGVPRGPVANPFGIPGIFPSTRPQPADVVFKKGVRLGGTRIFGIGSVIIFGLEVAIDILNRRQKQKIDQITEDSDEDLAGRARRRARESELILIENTADLPTINPDRPDLPLPDVIAPVRIPLPDRLPDALPQRAAPLEIEFPLPGTLPSQVPSPIGEPLPIEIPIPSPLAAPVEFPNPGQFEIENPLQLPGLSPFQFPLDDPFSVGDPLTGVEPRSVPSPVPQPGAGVDPSVAPFSFDQPTGQPAGFTAPQTAPAPTGETVDRCKPRTCEDELEEPRVECFKGLYREGVLGTDFTAWQQIDCLTGREI